MGDTCLDDRSTLRTVSVQASSHLLEKVYVHNGELSGAAERYAMYMRQEGGQGRVTWREGGSRLRAASVEAFSQLATSMDFFSSRLPACAPMHRMSPHKSKVQLPEPFVFQHMRHHKLHACNSHMYRLEIAIWAMELRVVHDTMAVHMSEDALQQAMICSLPRLQSGFCK